MNLGCYQLLAQLSAGPDGIAFRARDRETSCAAEVCVLSGARADAGRWQRLTRQLRLAALLEHPAAVPLRRLDLEHDPPFAVLASHREAALAHALQGRLPLAVADAVALARSLALVLATAHRLGLVHGRLDPAALWGSDLHDLRVDFSGIDAGAASPAEWGEVAASCKAPEEIRTTAAGRAADVYAVGALLFWWLTGQPVPQGPACEALRRRSIADGLGRLLEGLLAAEPAERPSAAEAAAALAALQPGLAPGGDVIGTTRLLPADAAAPALSVTITALSPARGSLAPAGSEEPPRQCLGRFRLLEKLGEGGMGAVYRAEDPADGSTVAVKVLRSDGPGHSTAVRRLLKEARLLAEVNNPHVTNLLEVNEDAGVHYLVLEFVAGKSLGRLLDARGRLDEAEAVAVAADVARGLAGAHERGIVHRDVKPDNILLLDGPDSGIRVKLSDFGLARHVVETESLHLTQTGAILGTPLYMAPEQWAGEPVGPPADVYALGATLFHALAGGPPFGGATQAELMRRHCQQSVPELSKRNPAVSEGVCQVVARCLAKAPAARYPDAGALLRDLERLLRGEPTSIVAHPRLPVCDPANVLRFAFTWELDAAPAQLWPLVSNTERLNRAVGLPAVRFTARAEEEAASSPGPARVRRFGSFRKAGLAVAWEEHPFEWVEGRRMGVLREYSQGPFRWLVSVVELAARPGGGSTLTHRVQLEPHGLLGRTVAAIEVGLRGRRSLDRVYRRMDAALAGKLGSRDADPFEEPAALPGGRRRRLDRLLDQLGAAGTDPEVVERLGDFLAAAPDQEVTRIRALALARRLGLDADKVVTACLHGARAGLLVLLWDVLCPVCRTASEVRDSLRALRDHGHCDACNLDFALDFANSVEMIFRAHPEVRDAEVGTYCTGGPAHFPHIAAQVRVGPGEHLELELDLPAGAYRLRGPQLPFTVDVPVEPQAPARRWDLCLSRAPAPDAAPALRTGGQVLALTNDTAGELVVRLERTVSRADALTAARAASLALFRELFPAELLSPGQLSSVATVTFLAAELDEADRLFADLGDLQAFAVLEEHFRLLAERVRRGGGAVVKTLGEGVLAVFDEALPAVRVACDLQAAPAAAEATRRWRLRVGVQRGPALAATVNDHLDYFGTTVRRALRLPRLGRGGDVVLSGALAADPQVAAWLQQRGLRGEPLEADLAGGPDRLLLRVRCATPG